MAQEERRANFILRHCEQYGNDPIFRNIVDSTVFLSDEQKLDSVQYVINRYGFYHTAGC